MKKIFSVNKGWLIIGLLVLIPIILWVKNLSLSSRFMGSYNSITSLGQISSLIGIVLYSLTFVLSSRWKFLEDLFGGMNRVYIAHHLLGGISFVLILIHPLLLAFARLTVSLDYAVSLFIPGTDYTVDFGIAGLFFMIALLILTFFINLPYQIWRLTHKFIGIAFFFGALHMFLVPSDVSRYADLRIYMAVIIGIGMISYLYRTVLGRLLVKKYIFSVDKVIKLKGNIIDLELSPQGASFPFEPGQFVFIGFHDAILGSEVHPFSISSSPNTRELRLTVKSLGDYTEKLSALGIGDKAYVEGPYGRFSYLRHTGKDQIWIAGGIGISPFLSMARSLSELDYKIDLFYCVREEIEAVHLNELINISGKYPQFRVFPVYSKINGRFTAQSAYKASNGTKDKEIFICGPLPMMRSLKKQFKDLGVDKDNIHTEEFAML